MSIKKICLLSFCLILTVGICSCNNQKKKDNALILENYSDDLRYSHNTSLYFIPGSLHSDFSSAHRTFDPSVEVENEESLLSIFPPDYIRSNIIALYSIYLNSEKIPGMIQLPDRELFDRYIAEFEEKPAISKDTLKELLQFEYSIFVIEEGVGLETNNFISTDAYSLYKGSPRYWLSEEDFLIFNR